MGMLNKYPLVSHVNPKAYRLGYNGFVVLLYKQLVIIDVNIENLSSLDPSVHIEEPEILFVSYTLIVL